MNSRKVMAIAWKDLSAYFSSPIGYVVLFIYFLVTGFFFYLIVTSSRSANMSPVFQNTSIIFLFITPIVTMRLWSEEEKSGTAELLRTSPLTLWEVVVGKFAASVLFFFSMMSAAVVYLIIILCLGNPDLGPVVAMFLGYILAAMAFFAIGLFASTLSENQIVSAVITFGVLLILWVLGAVGDSVQGFMGDVLNDLSIFKHMNDFFNGIIDLTHVFYFLGLIFLSLFLSVKVLENKRV